MNLKGKHICVTGCTSGLGYELTKLLLKEGSRVTGVGRSQEKLERVRKELNDYKFIPLLCDISNMKSVEEAFQDFGPIDALINNAAVIAYSPLEDHDLADVQKLVDTNVTGTIAVTKQLIPQLKKQNRGTIINVASTSGLPTGGHANQSVYMASKYAVQGFTEGLKKEFANTNSAVRILGFYPGGMDTDLFTKAGLDKDTSQFMSPEEVAKVIVFMLQSPDSIKIDHIVVNRNKFA